MHLVAMAVSLLLSGTAYAGGLGVLATGGIHTERVFYYSNLNPANGELYRDIADYDQFSMTQLLPQIGSGLNLVLGDRDDKITGDARFFWMMDTPQADPASIDTNVPDENVVADVRNDPRHVGLMMLGLSWGLVGSPDKVQLAAVGHVGSAFITLDHTEFLLVNVGPGVTVRLARQAQLFADVSYQLRYRKEFDHSVAGTLGVRYLFD
jgi:hypothetical protein